MIFTEGFGVAKKTKLGPIYLAAVGLIIIVLGVLVPSFFVSPFSTIGFSIIIGGAVLFASYIYFSVNMVASRGVGTIKWLVIPIIVLALVCGSIFFFIKHKEGVADRIYSTEDSVTFDTFTLKVASVKFNNVNLSVDSEFSKKYDIMASENCATLSTTKTWTTDIRWGGEKIWGSQTGPSDYDVCIQNAKTTKTIQDYENANKSLLIDYEITAIKTVDASKVNLEVVLDSGRDTRKSMEWLNNGDRWTYKGAVDTRGGITRNYYDSWTVFPIYRSYHESGIGGDINPGMVRKGNERVDIRANESTIDLVVNYKDESRIIRITR